MNGAKKSWALKFGLILDPALFPEWERASDGIKRRFARKLARAIKAAWPVDLLGDVVRDLRKTGAEAL